MDFVAIFKKKELKLKTVPIKPFLCRSRSPITQLAAPTQPLELRNTPRPAGFISYTAFYLPWGAFITGHTIVCAPLRKKRIAKPEPYHNFRDEGMKRFRIKLTWYILHLAPF